MRHNINKKRGYNKMTHQEEYDSLHNYNIESNYVERERE